jgi:drug/metabolite transporter (DMT)-like permease
VTAILFALVFASQVSVVAGQVLLKRGLNRFNRVPRATASGISSIAGGIAMLTLWFVIWMGLLRKMELSQLYPFEGLSPVLLVLAARMFLDETLTWRTWAGVALISAGTVLVGLSG